MKIFNFTEAAETLREKLSTKVKGFKPEDLEQLVHFALKYHAKIKGHHRGDDHEFNSRDLKHIFHRILADTSF